MLADRRAVSSMSGSWSSPKKHLLGTEQCSRGPTYWCQRIQHARQCSAMSHCIQTVWSKTAEPEDNAVECRWCDELMADIRGLAKTNTSKTSMRGYLKDGCKRYPGSSDRAGCLEQLSMNLGEIRQMLEAGVPDRIVCQLLGYCEASEVAPEVSRIEPSYNARNTCRDCYNFFEDAKEMYLGNYTEDEYKSMLVQQCEQAGYPAITELCKMVIEQYWPQIFARLEFFFDPAQTCYQLNFCNATNSNSKAKTTIPWSTLTSSRVRGSDAANQPQQLPINRMLLNVGSLPSIANTKVASKSVGTDVECVVCEFVMTYLDRMLENNYTEANIEAALDRVCRMMPKSVKDNCRVFVEQYAPAILVILGNELDPAMVCSGLKLCDQNKPTKQVCGPATCTTCTEVFQAIKTLLESYEENARLAEMIKGYCEMFPGEAKKHCDDVVVMYLPYVLQMAAQLLSPVKTCHAFKFCNL